MANLTNTAKSINTLCHELGHCVYHIGINLELPYLDQTAYPAVTEAVAMMMGDLQQRENILKGIVSDEILEKYKKEFKKSEVIFLFRSMLIITFGFIISVCSIESPPFVEAVQKLRFCSKFDYTNCLHICHKKYSVWALALKAIRL